jgi:hypothetical protein
MGIWGQGQEIGPLKDAWLWTGREGIEGVTSIKMKQM